MILPLAGCSIVRHQMIHPCTDGLVWRLEQSVVVPVGARVELGFPYRVSHQKRVMVNLDQDQDVKKWEVEQQWRKEVREWNDVTEMVMMW